MENYTIEESLKWRSDRGKRISVYVKLTAVLMIVGGCIWPFVHHSPLTTALSIALMVVPGIIILVLLKSEKINLARILSFTFTTGYFLIICYLSAGLKNEPEEKLTVYFWLVVLATGSYFFLYDLKRPFRDLVPATLLFLFFLLHMNIIGTPNIIYIEPAKLYYINRFTLFMSLTTLFLITRQFVSQIISAEESLTRTADELESLIGKMLPKPIAEKLRADKKTFAEKFDSCSVLFADVVEFTTWSESKKPEEVANQLNHIFSLFDDLIEKRGLTKIKTIGDCYMVASGIPTMNIDHAHNLVNVAFEMLKIAESDGVFQFRIGINSGPVVAGIIGKNSFLYDIWGDTVNTASRMESHGSAGKINISESTMELVKNDFSFSSNGFYTTRSGTKVRMYTVD
ncbi:MAG: adenylate/guanylate cyclase domain-containing protein [Bacteroidota bacterium]|jgi:class 3 adenylate cyclase